MSRVITVPVGTIVMRQLQTSLSESLSTCLIVAMDKMLPEPALTFTIPSLHDNTVLDCRVYHPLSLSPSTKAPPWRKHAAIIAHPYGPLGGSYDDPIVDAIASTLLRLGFLIGTFNFRY